MAKAKSKTVAAADAAPVAEYEALSPINHDGDDYAIGEIIELTDAQAKQLLEVNAIKPLVQTADDKGDDSSNPPSA